MKIFKLFKKKKTDFYELLEKHSKIVYEGNKLLRQFMDDSNRDDSIAEQIYSYEREADEIRRILIDSLNQTLITPFDRQDIFGLSREIDNLIDYAKSAVEEINLFRIKPNEHLINMTRVLEKGTLELYEAITNLKQHLNIAKEHAVEAKKTENYMHHLYLEALADLYNNNNEASYMLKMREIYRHLNRSSDRCDEAANFILDIIVKQ